MSPDPANPEDPPEGAIAVLRCEMLHVTLWPAGLTPLPAACLTVLRREGSAKMLCARDVRHVRTLYTRPGEPVR